jgi:hypothetical protein
MKNNKMKHLFEFNESEGIDDILSKISPDEKEAGEEVEDKEEVSTKEVEDKEEKELSKPSVATTSLNYTERALFAKVFHIFAANKYKAVNEGTLQIEPHLMRSGFVLTNKELNIDVEIILEHLEPAEVSEDKYTFRNHGKKVTIEEVYNFLSEE